MLHPCGSPTRPLAAVPTASVPSFQQLTSAQVLPALCGTLSAPSFPRPWPSSGRVLCPIPELPCQPHPWPPALFLFIFLHDFRGAFLTPTTNS